MKAVYVYGSHGCKVAVVQRGRRYYLRVWHPIKKQPRYRACKTDDLELAKQMAKGLARRLEDGIIRDRGVTLAKIFRAYLKERTPYKVERYQSEDRRRAEMWKAYLGSTIHPDAITLRAWERFQVDRGEGRIDARGVMARDDTETGGVPSVRNPSESRARHVRPRVIRGDLMWLRTVLRWAKAHGMIERNPCADWPLPSDPNPRRNMATEERLQAILEVASGRGMLPGSEPGAHGREELGTGHACETTKEPDRRVASRPRPDAPFGYLYELLTLCAETGRRIGAVRQLRYSDLLLKPSNGAPYGAIRWPARTDKARKDTVVPLSEAARRAVDAITQARPGLGMAPLFPSPQKPSEPVSHWYCRRWLEAAEEAAGLPHLDGTLFHAYRRKWATERKHLPLPDVAAAGGWTGPETLQRIYQQPDQDTMYRVVSEPGRVREAT